MLAVLYIAIAASAVAPLPDGLDSGGLVINELMIVPLNSSSTENGQWIELHNPGGNWVNLSDWILENEKGQIIQFNSLLIPPEGYCVVGACGIHSENGNYTPDAVWSSFSLSTQGSLSLRNQDSEAGESFSWDASWDILPGRSLERVNPGWAGDDRESWCHSTVIFGNGDYGTPGLQNSVFSDGFGQNTWAFIKAFVH